MGLGDWLTMFVVVGAIGFIVWTMPVGQRIANRLGLAGFRKEGAPKEDRDYLLNACGGDVRKVEALLAEVRAGAEGMSDAQAYRKAIRKLMRHKHGGKVA